MRTRAEASVRKKRWMSLMTMALLIAATPPGDTSVADAAKAGDLAAVQTLLREGADVNAAHGDGMSALHWAARQGHADIARVLLYAGAHPNSTTRLGGYTPLHLASREGHHSTVGALLEGGSDVLAVTDLGVTPLHFAAQVGNPETLTVLVEAGAEVDALQNKTRQTPLMWAAAKGHDQAVKLLLEYGADPTLTTAPIDHVRRASSDREARRLRNQLVEAQLAVSQLPPDGAEPDLADASAAQLNSQEEALEVPVRDSVTPEPVPGTPEANPKTPEANPETPEAHPETPEANPEAPGASPEATEATDGEKDKKEEQDKPEEKPSAPEPRPMSFTDLVGKQGGMAALHLAAREGHRETVRILLDGGADVNQPTGGDQSTPLLVAVINGNYDLASDLLEHGADPNLVSTAGAAPLFAVLNNRWAPKALYPQPTAFKQQNLSYLQLMELLLEGGADVDARLNHHLWYTSFNFDLLGVNFTGATPFWRAAYATDVAAMRLLVSFGADHTLSTKKAPTRRRRRGGDDEEDKSGLPPVEVGAPAVPPLHAASGVGYGQGFAGNAHRHVPDGWIPAVRYLVEELGHDVNARDHDGYSAVHHAAARGDNELIHYLVGLGAEVTFVSRNGQTTVDLANGPQQRVQPFPETIALLESLGAVNNHNCRSC